MLDTACNLLGLEVATLYHFGISKYTGTGVLEWDGDLPKEVSAPFDFLILRQGNEQAYLRALTSNTDRKANKNVVTGNDETLLLESNWTN